MAIFILDQYVSALVLLFLGTVTVVGFWLLNWLLAPKMKNRKNNIEGLNTFIAYECGEVPIGEAQTRFNFQYYVFALVFVVFDVVSSFLLIWAVVLRDIKLNGVLAAGSFLGVLAIGFGYWWKRNALRWM